MTHIPKKPRILLCNDDGIHAPGLVALQKIARALSDDVWVVAPESEQSGAGHSLSLRTPLRIRQIEEKMYAVNGTPTDCILVALRHLMRDCRPDLVLSGVNHGSNLAEDITYSGTVAAAMEATLFDIPALALSLDVDDGPPAWATAEHFGPEIIHLLQTFSWPSGVFLNVNFPNVTIDQVRGIRVAYQGQRPVVQDLLKTEDPRGRPYYWVGTPKNDDPAHPDTDLSAIQHKAIALTPVHINLTHVESLKNLTHCLSGFSA